MFVPAQYREPHGRWITDLVRDHPLAQLVSNGPAGSSPFITHAPMILDPGHADPDPDDLHGAVLWGHLNRANPHWAALGDAGEVTAVFTGPGSYVSPTVYDRTPAAPTWNFTAVHVRGTLRRVLDAEQTLATVTATVRAFEANHGTGWSMESSLDYFDELLPGVGAFRLAVTGVDAMFKLSQEQPPEVRVRVRDHFAGGAQAHHCRIAEMMDGLPVAEL
ncbi:FMN-binding negative transcriptional regulator [Lentzea sp. NPDC004782]|uniref:FMN-binding negative transcriptional regulator n=1 Tax=Lentzea sp. NPDC004782 TaxID=3154458 RepID=UPI0033BD2981